MFCCIVDGMENLIMPLAQYSSHGKVTCITHELKRFGPIWRNDN
ncbi:hypothetical protein L195_g044802, partial [Trifolium pratense]